MAQRQLQLFVHYLISTIGNEETFLQEFLENFEEILLCSYIESDVYNMMNYWQHDEHDDNMTTWQHDELFYHT